MKDKEKQDYKQVQVRLLTEHLIESENRQKQKCNEEKQIEITENAVRKSKDNAGTMADLLKQEMEELQRAKQIEEMSLIGSFFLYTYSGHKARLDGHIYVYKKRK